MTTGQFWPPTGGGGGHTIQDEGSALTARTGLNFVGSSVTAADDAANNRTNVTITGGGSTAPSDGKLYGQRNGAWVEIPNVIVLGPSDPIPGGTPTGTVVIRSDTSSTGGAATTVQRAAMLMMGA
jgi:hypothetical protein